MRRFYCHCGNEVLFHDHVCKKCGRDLAFDPAINTIWSGQENQQGKFIAHAKQGDKLEFSVCQHRYTSVACNWLVQDSQIECQCISCRTTRVVPDQDIEVNRKRWSLLESAKRQLFHSLLELKLIDATNFASCADLRFDFLEDKRSNPNVDLEHVLSGHNEGVITLNAAEADEGYLHAMKEQMQERYRTLLGHFRHEIGHYFWLKLFDTQSKLTTFRDVFGDERQDYAQALKQYYDKGNHNHWRSLYITPYASSHPHEDWAETWAHFLHIVDTLQTAQSFGISVYDPQQHNFESWFAEWARVVQIMNGLNRSMGISEPYPFKLSDNVIGKLRFIDEVVHRYQQ